MQSSISCIASNAQEERASNVDDEDRHHVEEEISTISNENISAQKEKHANTKRDAAPDSIAHPSKRRDRGRGKLIQQFPEKLMRILDSKEYEAILSWNKEGNAIAIHKPYDLVSGVLTTHFEASDDMKFDSFVRKLYRWGFSKLTVDGGKDMYFHPHFRRDNHESCSKITYTSSSQPSSTHPRRQERNDMPLSYSGQNETLDCSGFQSQLLSSSLVNGIQLDSNARLSPQNQESVAAFPVNHNIDVLANSFGTNENMAAPIQQRYAISNDGDISTSDEMNFRLLHMNTMTNRGQSSERATDMQQQWMESRIPIQTLHQLVPGRGGLPAGVPNSLTTSQQNITSGATSSSSRMPAHIPFQPPSFLHGRDLFHTADYSQVVGNASTNMTLSREIENMRKGNDWLLEYTNKQSILLRRRHMPQHLNASTPTKIIIDSAVQRQLNNNLFPGGTNLIQNNPNQISTHTSSGHTIRELEAIQHAKQILISFQNGMPALENNLKPAHLRHDT